ncbi:hypothetical protein, partial [Sphingobium sp. YR657]|uniref:hypothetical protein n=1 Tax=Sphingobium sp. YR657 TaxID=1884366 RepID=UPI0031379DA3
MSSKSLKSEYQKWLWMLATADLIVVLLALVPGIPSNASLAQLGNWRLLTTVVVPIGVLLLVNVLPHKVKCMLVYWKPYGWLPGCEVFSRFAPDDVRIDMANLTKNVGPGLSGFPCVAGHNGQQGVPLCHDAKNLPYRMSFSISFWRAALPVPPSSRA